MHPISLIAAGTRRLQALQPDRPLRGLTRFANMLHRWLPAYQGVFRLPNGVRMAADSTQPSDRWLLFAGNAQPALTHLLKQHTPPGGGCLDVGANLGFYTLMLAHWAGPQGRVAAFEANPALVERIAHNVALNDFTQVDIVDRPVHARSEPVTFYISPSLGKSSIHSVHVTQPVQTLTLTTITLDDYLQEHNWPRLDVIKLDIEGNDCNALLGTRASLARFHPFIVFEYWRTTPAEVARETFDMLAHQGYTWRGLLDNGQHVPFDWRTFGTTARHIDVVAIPG